MLKHQGLALTSAILLTLISTTSSAEFRRSEIQEADNNIYIAIGGGGGGMNAGDWKQVTEVVDPAADIVLVNQPDNKTVGTANGMAAIGYTFDEAPVRLELAYNYIGNGKFEWANLVESAPVTIIPAGSDVSAETTVFSNTLMVNGYLDFIVNEKFMPFVMIGAGYGFNSAKLEYTATIPDTADPTLPPTEITKSSDRKSTGNFVWNAAVGMNYALSESWTVGIAATYFYLGKMQVDAFNAEQLVEEDVHLYDVDRLDAFVATANIAYHF
ncbi:MAG: outer membrane protein [Gammaproteobacteria bacterium]